MVKEIFEILIFKMLLAHLWPCCQIYGLTATEVQGPQEYILRDILLPIFFEEITFCKRSTEAASAHANNSAFSKE